MNDCLGAILFCLAAFGAPVIRILAAAVGSEIILGADKGPGVFDNPFDLYVQFCRRDRLGHELMHASIPRLLDGAWLGMGGEHNDGNITVGPVLLLRIILMNSMPSRGSILKSQMTISASKS